MAEDALTLSFHGAAGTVTGSCEEFMLGKHRILVDCGMFQGSRTLEALNHGPFAFAPDEVDAVVLTHAHIDHCGLLPKLVAEGFGGAIWCTDATAELLPVMLADSARIQEGEVERHNRRRDRTGEARFTPLYTQEDAAATCQQLRTVPLGQWFEPAPGFRARLWNAGHILGSASVELEAGGVRVLCSGDLGPENKAFQVDPQAPSHLDHVICESTYGDRPREKLTILQRRALLEQEIRTAMARGGNLIIPVFALERTQELLLDIVQLANAGRIPNVSVFVDSPLASEATGVFAAHAHELEDTGGENVFASPAIHYVEDTAASIRLNSLSGAIILAASGMCEGGRVRHHLKHNLHRTDSTILFVGFQARGTLGRVILDGARHVRISGEDIDVRAHIRRIDSYSAHADRDELHAWIVGRKPIAGSLFLGHGEPESAASLAALVQQDDPAASIVKPQIGESYQLPAGAPARRTQTSTLDMPAMSGSDWQNDYADFAANLRQHLGRIHSEQQRRRALSEMRRILESYENPAGKAHA
jgi:metallo-beta-lactamase family protein